VSYDDEDNEPVALESATAVHATERALRVQLGDGKLIWIPQSQITDDSEVYAIGHTGRLVITAWFARKEGLA